MARNVRVLNLSRTPLRIGKANVAPALGNPETTIVDLDDGATRRDVKRFGDNLIVVGPEHGVRTAVVPLATVASAGGVFSWQNKTGKRVHVLRVDLDVTTQSSGACTVDVGTHASSPTTLSDNLIDGVSVAAAGLKSSVDDTDNGTNGVAKGQALAAGGYVNGSMASGALAGLVGNAVIHFTVAV